MVQKQDNWIDDLCDAAKQFNLEEEIKKLGENIPEGYVYLRSIPTQSGPKYDPNNERKILELLDKNNIPYRPFGPIIIPLIVGEQTAIYINKKYLKKVISR